MGQNEDMSEQMPEITPYELFGGAPFFERLIRHFYEGVATDPILRPMYPEGDLAPAERRLRMFFEQYWGGPETYSEERGHPRLRLRHVPYEIDDQARVAWLTHMRAAMDKENLPEQQEKMLWDYVQSAAQAMVNQFDR